MTTSRPGGGDKTLRDRAEDRLKLTRDAVEIMPREDVKELVYDLQVHQIELEMQNEALTIAHAETELARQKYRELYEYAPVGYLTLDREDKIRDANQMVATLFGEPMEAVIGSLFTRFIASESQDVYYIHKRSVLRTGERQNCHLRAATNEPLFFQINSQRAEGKEDSFHVVLTDITMMKKLEAKLSQMHEAANAANLAKSQFLANMSHEIRTPLNAIIGIGHLLKSAPASDKQRELISVLNTSADGLHSLVNEILDFSKVESGHIDLEKRPFDLKVVLSDVIRMQEIAASDKGLSLLLDYDLAVPCHFTGDAHRMRQIMLNLVSNAIKFTEQGRVSVHVHVLDTSASQMNLGIDVVDTGIGIPADKIADVFDLFTQADASTTRKFGGTGLGLTIAKRLVEQMNGSVAVTSEVGRGSTFHVTVPLPVVFPVAELRDEGRHALEENLKKRGKILVVDDFEPNLLVLTSYLDELGYECDTCSDGLQAIAKWQAENYAIVFMDIQMPVMDGLAATTEIRRLEKESGATPIPIIAVSAHSRTDQKQRCFDAGTTAYVAKPFRPEDILATLGGV